MARNKLTRADEHSEQQDRTTLNVWDSTADTASADAESNPDDDNSTVIGIDLGTTNSCVAFWDKTRSRAKVIRIGKEHKDTMPSVAYLTEQGNSLVIQSVGYEALDKLTSNNNNNKNSKNKQSRKHKKETETVSPTPLHNGLLVDNVKRILGRNFDDAVVQEWRGRVPYHIQRHKRNVISSAPDGVAIALAMRDRASTVAQHARDSKSAVTLSLGPLSWLWQRARTETSDKANSSSDELDTMNEVENGACVVPEDISAALLEGLKTHAESHLGHTVTRAVIAVPAYFNDAQRQATRAAGEASGLKVLKLVSEPMAAAISYGLFVAGSKTVAVFDLGGGTLDVSVLRIEEGTIKALAIGGDNMLGGDDFDLALMKHWLSIVSSAADTTRSDLSVKLVDDGDNDDERVETERPVFNASLRTLSTTAFVLLKRECERAKRMLSIKDSAEIILTSTVSSLAREGLTNETPTSDRPTTTTTQEPLIRFSVRVSRKQFEHLCAPMLERCRTVSRAVLADCGGLAKAQIDDVVLVGGSTQVPAVRAVIKEVFERDELCVSVRGDRAVAEGAAIQGAILAGVDRFHLSKVLLFDATPFSIGLEDAHGKLTVMIPRNSQFPVSVTKRFFSFRDHQPAVTVDMYEGEKEIAHDNHWLGNYNFPIPDGSQYHAGERSLEITFSITQDGVLAVAWRVPEDEHDLCGDYGAGHDDEDPPMQTKQFVLLGVYALILALLYVVLRLGVLDIDATFDTQATVTTENAVETIDATVSAMKPEL